MRRIALLAIAAGFVFPLMAAAPANAQATRTWVSGVGDDVNPCSRTAPCKTFAGAISKTAAGGEINCLDSAGFGALTVTKSMTVSCVGVTGGVLAAGSNGINFNGGAADYLYLRGLDFEGLNKTGVPGLNGINWIAGGTLQVEDCTIRNFSQFGIAIKPSVAGNFVVNRVTLFNNTSGGIQIRPTAGVTTGTIDQSSLQKNGVGLTVDGFGGTSGVNVSVRDTTITANTTGVQATSTVGVNVMMMGSTIASNVTGLSTANAGATIRLGSSILTGSGTAIVGNVLSYGNNQINGNAADPIPAAVALH